MDISTKERLFTALGVKESDSKELASFLPDELVGRAYIFDIVAIYNKNGVKGVRDRLETTRGKSFIHFLLNGELLEEHDAKKEQENSFLRGDRKVLKMGIKCRKCPSENIQIIPKQIRSGDEPPDMFCKCHSCGTRWKM